MGIVFWLRMAALLIGGSLAAYGCFVLATGRLSHRSRASFRPTRDAGMYPLCSGVGVMLLAFAQFFIDAGSLSVVLTLAALTLAMFFMGLAVFRYRPRRPDSVHDLPPVAVSQSRLDLGVHHHH